MGEWISVKDMLPRKDGKYLCAVFDYVTRKHWIAIDDYKNKYGWSDHTTVTHWMLLPEPPCTVEMDTANLAWAAALEQTKKQVPDEYNFEVGM